MGKTYTWDDLFERAIDTACLSPELRAKDEARNQLAELISDEAGYDIEQCDCPEDEIDSFLWQREQPVLFDAQGNIIRE